MEFLTKFRAHFLISLETWSEIQKFKRMWVCSPPPITPLSHHLVVSSPRRKKLTTHNEESNSTLTLTLASVRFVHIAISSLVLMSGYRFRANVASSSCNCCEVKCVRCRLWRLFVLLLLCWLLELFFDSPFDDDRDVMAVVETLILELFPLSLPSSDSPPIDLDPPPPPVLFSVLIVTLPIESVRGTEREGKVNVS